jgi:polyphosphate glucokinase
MIVDGIVEPMELAHLRYKKGRTYEDYVGLCGLKRLGKKRWRRHVGAVVELLKEALKPDDVVIGGGNAKNLAELPPGSRLGDNANAFWRISAVEGYRMTKRQSGVGYAFNET